MSTRQLVDLNLDLPRPSFVEGSTIEATLRATASRDVVVEDGGLELLRTISYRYTTWNPYATPFTATARSAEVVSHAAVGPVGPLAAGQPLVQPVTLAIPAEGPGSVQAQLVEIGWAVHARLRIGQAREAEVTRQITVLSRARDRAEVAHSPPAVEDHGGAVLGFESLSSRRLIPGVPLSGVLSVEPLRSFSARGVRVDLVLLEHVLHGPWLTDDPARNPAGQDKYTDTVVASLPLASQLGFEVGQLRRFEFTLPVPAPLQGPTMRTANFSLTWLLRGVVDRQVRRDPCVAAELHAVTTPE